MASDPCATYTYSTVVQNPDPATVDAGDVILIVKTITGLDGAPIRASADNKGLTDGTNLYLGTSPRRRFYAGRVVTFAGEVVYVKTPGGSLDLVNFADAAVRTAFNTLEAAVVAALQAQLNTATALTWTPEGLTAHSLSCAYGNPGGEIQFAGDLPNRTYQFTLVSESAAITVA